MNGLLNRRFTVYRRTAILVAAATLAASHSAAITPTVPYAVEVEISGSGTLGTVTITGTIGGTAGQTQVLTFGSAGRQATTKVFDRATTIAVTTSGWVGTWTITVRAVNRDGSQIKELSSVATSWPGRLSRTGGTWGGTGKGSQQMETPLLFMLYTATWSPRAGDEAVDSFSGERWRFESIPTIDGMTSPSHWEIPVNRAED